MGIVAFACVPKGGPTRPEPATSADPACAGVEAVDELWTPTRRAKLAAALDELPGEWPEQLLASLDARMPAYAREWTDAHAQARTESSSAAMRCLEARMSTLDAVLALIVDKPERAASLWSVVERASAEPSACVGATVEAPELGRGRELARLAMLVELRELDEAEVLLEVLEADPTLAEAETSAWQLLVARAQIELAAGRTEAADAALTRAEALVEALGPGPRALVADARAGLAEALGDAAGAEAARSRAVAAAREQADLWLLVDQLHELGRSRLAAHAAREAVTALVEAIALSGRAGGPDNPRTAQLQVTLAAAQFELGQVEAAYDALTQARDAFVIALGPDHPDTLATVEAIGRLFILAGRPGDAQFAFLDLLEVYTDLYGVKDWRTAKVKLELADSLMAMDQHQSAQTLYTEALTPLAQALGAVDPLVVRASIHLGIAELALGNLEAAQPHCERGRDLAKALAVDDPLADEAQRCLAEIAARQAKAKNKRKR